MKPLNIAVLFDGAGLARLGLEQAGHTCTGYELDPAKHYLSTMVGSGNCVLADVRDVDLSGYDAVWASPPCQAYSEQRQVEGNHSEYGDPDLLHWSMSLPHDILWVENVLTNPYTQQINSFNAAQFLPTPLQRRRRMVAGRYSMPKVYRGFKQDYKDLSMIAPPACLAMELNHWAIDVKNERRRFSYWYRKHKNKYPNAFDMAKAQGFNIPFGWLDRLDGYTVKQWHNLLGHAIGNGVPVYMAKAFGDAVFNPQPKQMELFTQEQAR